MQRKYDDIICVCMGKKCKKNNAKKIVENLRKHIKKVDSDKTVLLVKTKCLNQCESGPIVIKDSRLIKHFRVDTI
jgi:NADH:ubiquinone oxidoreductase subunit E